MDEDKAHSPRRPTSAPCTEAIAGADVFLGLSAGVSSKST